MKKLLFLLLLILFPLNVFAENEINIYFFHADGCSNCEVMDTCLNNLKDKYVFNVIKYQVRDNEENTEIMNKVKKGLSEKNLTGVPFIAIGNKYVYGGSEYKCKDLEDIISDYSTGDYVDIIPSIINDNYVKETEEEVVLTDTNTTSDDLIETLKNPKIILTILLIIMLLTYYVITSRKEKNNEKE